MIEKNFRKYVPEVRGNINRSILYAPKEINDSSGIIIKGKRLKSFIFSTDVAILRNTNADAVIAVYPFIPQPVITQSIMEAAYAPVFCGIGGNEENISIKKTVSFAKHAEYQGASGVVANAGTSCETIYELSQNLDIPILCMVDSTEVDVKSLLEVGASIISVSAGENTAEIVAKTRKDYPYFPIIASGGPSKETIKMTIEAGANAISFLPPSTAELFLKQN